MMKVLVPLGTRPEIIKLAPVVRALAGRGLDVRTVATGQHASPAMTDVLFEEFAFSPDARWQLDGDEAARTGGILCDAMREIAFYRPDIVLLLGDTYTVPLFSLAARRHGVPVAHVEAGLRSFNERSLEEVNRRIAAATVSLHLAPTAMAARFLAREGVAAERVRVVGNPIIDVLRDSGVARVRVRDRAGVVFTTHRATNVDDPERLELLVELVGRLARDVGPVVFPVHPRTQARLDERGLMESLRLPGVSLHPPLSFRAMLEVLARCRVVVTDSGGLQEEASWFGVPTVILRNSTPRWEGVAAGVAVLSGVHLDRALEAAATLARPDEQARVAAVPCLYGDGHTSARIARLLADEELLTRLAPREPHGVLPLPV